MIRVSSNLTLVLKIFIPTMWIVFFGMMTIAILLAEPGDNPLFGNPMFKLGTVLFFVFFLLVIYFTILQLLRVEFGQEVFTATNYLKNYQYRYGDVEYIKEYDLIFKKLICIKMKAKTSFGTKLYFLRSAELYDQFVIAHPDTFSALIKS